MSDLGLVTHRKGKHRGIKNAFDETGRSYQAVPGIASHFRATPELLGLAEARGITPKNARQHFEEELPQKPVELRAASTRLMGQKVSGKKMTFERTPEVTTLENEVRALNEFLSKFTIRNAVHRGYRRIFNEGDRPDFAWNKGGRLYGGDDNYQRQKGVERRKMTIDGSPVVEIDITASYLTILHAMLKAPFDADTRDPYEVEGIDRRVVKTWMTVTFGNNKPLTQWPKGVAAAFHARHGLHLPSIASAPRVKSAMEQRHPVLQGWGTQGITWADLMFAESKAMISAMLDLMEQGLPSLSVHDSLIVRKQDEGAAVSAIDRHYHEVIGVHPSLKVTPGTS